MTGKNSAEILGRLYELSFTDNLWKTQDFAAQLQNPAFIALCAVPKKAKNQNPVGFVAYNYSRINNHHESELVLLATLPTHHRQGVATSLLKSLEIGDFVPDTLSKPQDETIVPEKFFTHNVLLEVAIDNSVALSFYKKHGYQKYGIREKYYKRPSGTLDAVLLKKCFI